MSFRLLELLKLPPGYWEALDIHALLAGMAVMVEVSRPPPPTAILDGCGTLNSQPQLPVPPEGSNIWCDD